MNEPESNVFPHPAKYLDRRFLRVSSFPWYKGGPGYASPCEAPLMAELEGEISNSDIATEEVAGRPGRPRGGSERSEFAVNEKLAELEGEISNSDIATEEVAGRPGRPRGGSERSEFAVNEKLAERKGFEPSRRFPAYSLSRGAPSTTRPPLHRRG